MGQHNIYDKLKRSLFPSGVSTDPVLERIAQMFPTSGPADARTGFMFAYGDTVPSAVAGYAVGCLFLQLTPAAGVVGLLQNTGTAASCTFTKVSNVDNILAPAGKTIGTADADGIRANSVILPQFVNITHKVVLTNNLGEYFFIADRAYTVISIKEIHAVVATNPNVLKVRKCTAAGTALPGAAAGATCVEFITAGFDTQAAAATAQTGTLAVTTIAAGDKLAVLQGADITGLVGQHISLKLQCA